MKLKGKSKKANNHFEKANHVQYFKPVLAFLVFCLFSTPGKAQPPAHHQVTINAIEKCLGTTKKAIEKGQKKHPLISCNIPFSFKEAELDALLTQKGQEPDQPEKRRHKASKATVKTIINVRSAKCMAKVRVKTGLVQQAIDKKHGELILPPQWVTCNLTTKSKKAKQVRFAFTPTGTFENNCLTQFSPKMGKFNLDCTFCRLNLVAQTLRYWVNKIGSQMTPGINRSLGKQCKT